MSLSTTEATTALAAGGAADCTDRQGGLSHKVRSAAACRRKSHDTTAAQMVCQTSLWAQACCVLDKATARLSSTTASAHAPARSTSSGTLPPGQYRYRHRYCRGGGVVAMLRGRGGNAQSARVVLSGRAGKACANAVVQPTELVRNAFFPRWRCVATEICSWTVEPPAARWSRTPRSAISAAAAKLYRSSVKDVTADAADVPALCSDVKDCTTRVRSFLQQPGCKQLVVPQHAQWTSPTGALRTCG